jgi:hypothetical protein
MFRFRSKLMCLSKLVNVTENRKDTSSLQNLSIFVNYESVMFYSTSPWASYEQKES